MAALRRLFAEELEARLDELLLLRLRQRSGRKAAARLARLPREAQDAVLAWVEVAAQSSTELGWLLAGRADENLDDLAGWARGILAAHDRGGLEAARAALHASGANSASPGPESSRAPAAELLAMQPRLAGLWRALTGSSLTVSATTARAWSDGETLWLPARLDVVPTREGNECAYLALLACLWAQVRFGTFSTAETLSPPNLTPVQHAWLEVCEAVRLEARLREALPGLASFLSALHGDWPEDLASVRVDLERADAGLGDSLRWATRLAESGMATPDTGTLPAIDWLAVKLRAAAMKASAKPVRPLPLL